MEDATRAPITTWWASEKLLHVHLPPLFFTRMKEDRERRQRLQERRHRERLTIYTYGTDDEKMRVVFSKVDGSEWMGSDKTKPPASWERFSHYPLDQLALRPQRSEDLDMRMDADWLDPTSPPHVDRAVGVGSAMRAWLFGTALIAIIVLIIRSLDKCLHSKLVKSRKLCHDCRESGKQNNHAINQRRLCNDCREKKRVTDRKCSGQVVGDGSVLIPALEALAALPNDRSGTVTIDMPPSYCECLSTEPPGFTGIAREKAASGLATEQLPPYLPDCSIKYSKTNGRLPILTLRKKQTLLVNQPNIVGHTVIMDDETKTTEQNMKNTDMEVANEAAKVGEKSDPGTGSSELTVAMNDDENTHEKMAPLLV